MTNLYSISDEQFNQIEKLITEEYKAINYQTTITTQTIDIPNKPDKEFLEQYEKKQRKIIEKAARDYDTVKFIIAVKNDSKNKADIFIFMKNRAKQQWTYTTQAIKKGTSKAWENIFNTNMDILLLLGIFANTLFIGVFAIIKGVQWLGSSRDQKNISKKVKAIFS
ncbi:hypothetical protein OXT66_00875 [Lentilactobacillus senioris]|uniref:hypothetical protein n=1 Tax=Lentilactobacillus senioris TaxID=931534 RepID=UPI00227ED316|nr:hypothetical protein [Lentilactobacillus senioris]MCY9806098.1 hypothetical protein [Lentilactobacillus senioris]